MISKKFINENNSRFFMKDNEVHIGAKIKEKLLQNGMSIETFAHNIFKDRSTVYNIFNRKSIDTELLILISKVLNYNFFLEYDYFATGFNFKKKTTITFEVEYDSNNEEKIHII